MIDRQKLAQEMAKIADDLEYGLRPEKAVEKLAQSIHGVTKAGELLAHLGFKP